VRVEVRVVGGYIPGMDVSPTLPTDGMGESSAPLCRVRIWTAPPSAGFAWLVDEWDVGEADDVLAVIAWAESKVAEGGCFEVFVREAVPMHRARFTRLFGRAPEGPGATETVYFSEAR
jgi:hypothetical protein